MAVHTARGFGTLADIVLIMFILINHLGCQKMCCLDSAQWYSFISQGSTLNPQIISPKRALIMTLTLDDVWTDLFIMALLLLVLHVQLLVLHVQLLLLHVQLLV